MVAATPHPSPPCESPDGNKKLTWVVGSAMVLGSFQCRSVLLLWHMVGQGPAVLAVLAAGVGWVDCFFFLYIVFISSFLSSFPNASSVGRRLDILKYCGLCRYYPVEVVSFYRRRAC